MNFSFISTVKLQLQIRDKNYLLEFTIWLGIFNFLVGYPVVFLNINILNIVHRIRFQKEL